MEGINRIIHLQQQSFVIPNMPVYSFNSKGKLIVDRPFIQDDCYYSGYVEGALGSEVVLSTCTGLRGHIQVGSSTYEIQPIENSPKFQHLIYRAAAKPARQCQGVLEDKPTSNRNERRRTRNTYRQLTDSSYGIADSWDSATPTSVRYLEYYAVCDHSLYVWEDSNETQVMISILNIMAILHRIYEEVGLRVVLTGMELWAERNYATISEELEKTLEEFYTYATFELRHRVHFDHACIFTITGDDDVFGMSWGERLCLYNHVSVSVVKTATSVLEDAIAAAHELGHSLGFDHDDLPGQKGRNCHCNCSVGLGHCIMFSEAVACTHLSNCSKNAYSQLIAKSGKECLLNKPANVFQMKTCGNGVVEGDEECDCGLEEDFEGTAVFNLFTGGGPLETMDGPNFFDFFRQQKSTEPTEQGELGILTSLTGGSFPDFRGPQECRRNSCCMKDCTLKPGIDCLYGLCCEKCKIAKEGTVCRKAATECDLPEYCSGASADCPEDMYKQDGMACGTNENCYLGKCLDLHRHCRAVFGPETKSAPLSCYKEVNMLGDRTGNCGEEEVGYKKCKEEDVFCGRIQCTNLGRIPKLSTGQGIIQTPIDNVLCWGIEFHEGQDVYDLGAIKDGSKCGANKICINRSCVDLAVLNYDCDLSRCNHRGVCNNLKHCHCIYGWAPPFCEGKGYGGSIESGPPPARQISTQTLLLGSLGTAMLLLIVLVVFRKRIVALSTAIGWHIPETPPVPQVTQQPTAEETQEEEEEEEEDLVSLEPLEPGQVRLLEIQEDLEELVCESSADEDEPETQKKRSKGASIGPQFHCR